MICFLEKRIRRNHQPTQEAQVIWAGPKILTIEKPLQFLSAYLVALKADCLFHTYAMQIIQVFLKLIWYMRTNHVLCRHRQKVQQQTWFCSPGGTWRESKPEIQRPQTWRWIWKWGFLSMRAAPAHWKACHCSHAGICLPPSSTPSPTALPAYQMPFREHIGLRWLTLTIHFQPIKTYKLSWIMRTIRSIVLLSIYFDVMSDHTSSVEASV